MRSEITRADNEQYIIDATEKGLAEGRAKGLKEGEKKANLR